MNINNPNTSGAAGALARAGVSNAEITRLLNARIQNGQFSEIKSYAELQGRLALKEGGPVRWLDGQGRYVKAGAQRSTAAKQAKDAQQAKEARAAKDGTSRQIRATTSRPSNTSGQIRRTVHRTRCTARATGPASSS